MRRSAPRKSARAHALTVRNPYFYSVLPVHSPNMGRKMYFSRHPFFDAPLATTLEKEVIKQKVPFANYRTQEGKATAPRATNLAPPNLRISREKTQRGPRVNFGRGPFNHSKLVKTRSRFRLDGIYIYIFRYIYLFMRCRVRNLVQDLVF